MVGFHGNIYVSVAPASDEDTTTEWAPDSREYREQASKAKWKGGVALFHGSEFISLSREVMLRRA